MNIDPKSDNQFAYLVYRLVGERQASRSIDGDIFALLNPSWIHKGDGKCVHGDGDGTCERDAPHYTSNTDTALTLKHEADQFDCWNDPNGVWRVRLSRKETKGLGKGDMPTMALAVTVAALMRMEQRQRGDA